MIRPALPLLLVFVAWLVAGCEQAPQKPQRSHGVRRIVSGSPAATEICCALGLRDRLIGRSRYCRWPLGIDEVPSIGGLNDANPEILLELEPDLILISGNSRVQRDRFGQLGLRIESLPDGSLDDIYAAIRRVGELTSRDVLAEELVSTLTERLDRIDDDYPQASGRRVLITLGPLRTPPDPPTVVGPGTYLNDMLIRAGYKPAMGVLHAQYAAVGLEAVARANPQMIVEVVDTLEPGMPVDRAKAWGRLGPLEAVEQNRIVQLVGSKYTIPGPRVGEVYDDLRAALAEADAR